MNAQCTQPFRESFLGIRNEIVVASGRMCGAFTLDYYRSHAGWNGGLYNLGGTP